MATWRPLRALAQAARARGAWFVVDDAHGLGVTGPTGRGTLESAGLGMDEVPLLVGTLGKAFGCFGAFVAGSREAIELIQQRARSYIYTTALPPGVATAASEALRIAEEEAWRRERLRTLIARFRAGAAQRGLALGDSTTPIQPLLIGDTARCLAASDALRERGFWVAAIRRPTVPAGTERLRITLTSHHEEADVDALLEALSAVLREAPARVRRVHRRGAAGPLAMSVTLCVDKSGAGPLPLVCLHGWGMNLRVFDPLRRALGTAKLGGGSSRSWAQRLGRDARGLRIADAGPAAGAATAMRAAGLVAGRAVRDADRAAGSRTGGGPGADRGHAAFRAVGRLAAWTRRGRRRRVPRHAHARLAPDAGGFHLAAAARQPQCRGDAARNPGGAAGARRAGSRRRSQRVSPFLPTGTRAPRRARSMCRRWCSPARTTG